MAGNAAVTVPPGTWSRGSGTARNPVAGTGAALPGADLLLRPVGRTGPGRIAAALFRHHPAQCLGLLRPVRCLAAADGWSSRAALLLPPAAAANHGINRALRTSW